MFVRVVMFMTMVCCGLHAVEPQELAKAALDRTKHDVRYEPAYVKLKYPMGDVPADTGVCTDVVIRTYRAFGIDLQELVHKDMKANFGKYPKIWGAKSPNPSIDHRRVPNLRRYFSRHGVSIKPTGNASDYKPGDIITWNLKGNSGNLPHIGIVSNIKARDKRRYLVVHNIGAGPKLEDVLFEYKITGHYQFKLGSA